MIQNSKSLSGNMIGLPHTVPQKSTGKSGSVAIRLVPAPKVLSLFLSNVPSYMPLPFLLLSLSVHFSAFLNPFFSCLQGAGLVAGATSKKVLAYAGIKVTTSSSDAAQPPQYNLQPQNRTISHMIDPLAGRVHPVHWPHQDPRQLRQGKQPSLSSLQTESTFYFLSFTLSLTILFPGDLQRSEEHVLVPHP
jgi:hypothetical protein